MVSTVGLIIDILIIAILIIFGLIGMKNGLFKSVLSVFSFGLCVLIAFLTAKHVAGWLNGLYDFSGWIGGKISNSLSKNNDFFAQSINTYETLGKDGLISAIPGGGNKLLTQLIKVIFSNTNVDMSSTETIGSLVGTSIGHICMIVIAGILVFIVLKVAVFLLTKFFDNLCKTKIIGGLNKVLGLILGLLKGTIIIMVINVIAVALSMVPTVNKVITPVIQDNTSVERFVYNTTDKLFEKYVIEGDGLQTWIENLWENR